MTFEQRFWDEVEFDYRFADAFLTYRQQEAAEAGLRTIPIWILALRELPLERILIRILARLAVRRKPVRIYLCTVQAIVRAFSLSPYNSYTAFRIWHEFTPCQITKVPVTQLWAQELDCDRSYFKL